MASGLKIVLASSSPRRRDLMKELFGEFIFVDPSTDETSIHLDPEKRAIQNAEGKAVSVSSDFQDSVIIAADTIVYLDGFFLGKPVDDEDARHMLSTLSGKTHQVYTGVAVLDTSNNKIVSGCAVTDVEFKELSPEEIEDHVASGEPMDKAGAYAIQGQGETFIRMIDGSRSNVIGLPLELLEELCRKVSDAKSSS